MKTDIITGESKQDRPEIRVNRYNTHIDVLLDTLLLARRDEATGEIAWHTKMDQEDRIAVTAILAKLPRRLELNRAQRRRMRHYAKKAGRGKV